MPAWRPRRWRLVVIRGYRRLQLLMSSLIAHTLALLLCFFGCCYRYCNGRRYNDISGERRDLERKIIPDSYVGEVLRDIIFFFLFFFNWAWGKFF